MKILSRILFCLALFLSGAVDAAPLRVFIRAGEKTHGPGEHDWPRFLNEWKPFLESRGAQVEGAKRFPTDAELLRTDVVIVAAAHGGDLSPDERVRWKAFLDRGGGVVVLHDGLVSADPVYWSSIVGGAFEEGRSRYYEGRVGVYLDTKQPFAKGAANFFVDDELYWDLHLSPSIKILGRGFRTVQEITPQIWTYESGAHRAFVSIPGHKSHTLTLPHYRTLLLRGLAWAGRRPVDALVLPSDLAALRYPEGGPVAPAKAAQTLKVHPDFDLSLVAAEPDVIKPVALDWDARGRLWVLEMPQYPEKAAPGQFAADALVILEDSNGDGKWDKRIPWCTGLDLANSFVFHRDGVIVSQPPQILFLRDTDGDDRCDRREVIFQGFGLSDTHAVINSFRWGVDGWVYADQGYSGRDSKDIVNAAGRRFGPIGNSVFRFRPDGSAIEVVSSIESNSWGIDFTWDNELVFTMANGSHLRQMVLSDAVLGRGKVGQTRGWLDVTDHHDLVPLVHHTLNPYVQIDHIGGFTSAVGSTVYTGGAWPALWDGTHFSSEPTVNLVHRDLLVGGGPHLLAKRQGIDEFLAGRDLWFRPVETRIGPDGALYIGDFYNLAVAHNDTRGPLHGPFNAALRPDRDHEHGRIWRVQHKQARVLESPRMGPSNAVDLVKQLGSPNRLMRMTAQRLLVEKGGGASELKELVAGGITPAARIHALWTLHGQGGLQDVELKRALGDLDPGVRKNAAVLAYLYPDKTLASALRGRLSDPDPRVRMQVLVSLGRHPDPETRKALVDVYGQLGDDWSRSAVVGSLAPEAVAALGDVLNSRVESVKRVPLAEALAGIIAERTAANGLGAALRVLAATPDRGPVRTAALGRLSRDAKVDEKSALTAPTKQALGRLMSDSDPMVAAAALGLALRWTPTAGGPAASKTTAQRLLRVAGAKATTDEVRVEIARVLLRTPGQESPAVKMTVGLLQPAVAANVQTLALAALGAAGTDDAGRALIAAIASLRGSIRDGAVGQILGRAKWADMLVSEIEAGRIRPVDLGPAALFRLRRHADKSVALRSGRVLDAILGDSAKEKNAIIAHLLPLVSSPGNLGNGREALTKNCLVCHSFKGEGAGFAPDLTGMGSRGPAEVLVHVIDPNRHVEPNFVAVDVTTKTGTSINGLVESETPQLVVLRNAIGRQEIKRADIAVMASAGLSLMPDGFESLGPDVLRDIMAVLGADAGRFRTLDLAEQVNASTRTGLYGKEGKLRLAVFGTQTVDDVPFLLADPEKAVGGNNALVLTPGAGTSDLRLGFTVEKLHILGGIAAGGVDAVGARSKDPVVKIVYRYLDGKTEEHVLHDGVEFATWKKRVDVPGSRYATGLLPDGVPGQIRRFEVRPLRKVVIARVTLEGIGDKRPTLLAVTAEVPGGAVAPNDNAIRVLIMGGGESHDFDKHWGQTDVATLTGARFQARYTTQPPDLAQVLSKGGADVIFLANNQPLVDPVLRADLSAHVNKGRGLVIAHAASWYGWKDWPEFNRTFVGGGTSSHEALAEFEVTIVDDSHALTRGVPRSFRIKDELYRFLRDSQGAPIDVLAMGRSLKSGAEYPVLWTVQKGPGRVVVTTLGHDAAAHEGAAYQTIIKNAVKWAAKR